MSDFLKKLLSGLGEKPAFMNKEYTELSVGDKVNFKDHRLLRYMLDSKTKKPIDTKESPLHPGLKTYFLSGEAILGEFLSEPVIYNCGHCPKEHEANAVIYFPHIKTKFYVDKEDICLPEESICDFIKAVKKETDKYFMSEE